MKYISQLIRKHLTKYPAMQLLDVYKLLHQAALGNSHHIDSPEQALQRLRDELNTMGEGPAEPIWEPISPDGRLVRVHLRAYGAAGLDMDSLARACTQSPETCPPAPDKLVRFCNCLGDLTDEGILPFSRQDVVACVDELAEAGYPAVHHTRTFREQYRPAYRVVDVELLPPAARAAT